MQITLPASPVTAQLIGRTQNSSSTGAVTTISQQAMLLGNRPANCNQAQMYLRTQMVQIPFKYPELKQHGSFAQFLLLLNAFPHIF